jgi:hypothetical protein
MTSPPFALLGQKAYGNEEQDKYVEWLGKFGEVAYRVLKDSGSFVLDLGVAYKRGKPVRSLYNYCVLLDFCDRLGYELAEEFFWFNPSKLPSPIEWVNKRKIRAKDSVNTVWWFSRTAEPKADVTRVLVPYSERMKTLLKNPEKFYRPHCDVRVWSEGAATPLPKNPEKFYRPHCDPPGTTSLRRSARTTTVPFPRTSCRFRTLKATQAICGGAR